MLQRPRGTRDFAPSEMARRRQVEKQLRQTVELFGYREISTPVFELTELFTKKSGDAIVNQMYSFEDKGGRGISLRPELTVPTIRFYADELHKLPKPLKIYYYGNCFRYERPQKGRFREFWQFGVELIEAGTPESQAEVVALAVKAILNTGLKGFKVRIGHLEILKSILNDYGITPDQQGVLMPLIDKKDLVGLEETMMSDLGLGYDTFQELSEFIGIDIRYKGEDVKGVLKGNEKLQNIIKNHPDLGDKVETFEEVLEYIVLYGVQDFTVDLGVARGIDYYSGIVFEIDAPELGTEKQICGGGEYSLYDVFDIKEINSIGFAIGFDRVFMALESQEFGFEQFELDAYIIPLSDKARSIALKVATDRRENMVVVDVDLVRRNISKGLKYANAVRSKFAIIIGDDELARNSVTVRNMDSGDQQLVPISDLVTFFIDRS